jgi:hypothetical protein
MPPNFFFFFDRSKLKAVYGSHYNSPTFLSQVEIYLRNISLNMKSSSSDSSSSRPRRGKKRPRSESLSVSSSVSVSVSVSRQSVLEDGEQEDEEQEEQEQPKQEEHRNRMRRPRPQRIIVLGSGVSGLACSRELRQRGYEVLVVEARSRVGGRLKGEVLELGAEYPCTLPASFLASSSKKKQQQKQPKKKKSKASEANFDSNSDIEIPTTRQHPVDVGGALIHGIENNPIYHITSRMGVPIHDVSSYCLLMDENGWPFDPKVDEKSSNFFNECLDVTFARAEKDRESKESFGVLFEKVCREISGNINVNVNVNVNVNGSNGHGANGRSTGMKNGGKPVKNNKNWETPLLKWHRANLELPSGASFYDLGHTWNEDEPYGFDGDHVAVEPSWKLVMERLADGLDILNNSPVTEIRVVLPNGTTPLEIPKTTAQLAKTATITTADNTHAMKKSTEDENDVTKSSEQATKDEMKAKPVKVTDEPEPKLPLPTATPAKKVVVKRARKPKQAFGPGVNAVENRRFSRRTRNIDTDVRRSSRCTKGIIQRLEYAKGWDDSNRRKRRKSIDTKNNAEDRKLRNLDDNGEQLADDGKKKRKENGHEEGIDYAPSSVVQITLQNGSVLEADALVCTLPLGVLKLPQKDPSHVRFVPSLDPSKKDAIENLGCGLLNKCAISFPNAFWQDSDFLGLAESHYSYLVLNAMKYTQKPILIFMYGGDFAKDVEDWTDGDIVSDCLDVLKKICGIREIPPPIDYCVTRWGKEEYSRMAFTCIPPGVDGGKALTAMSQPVCDPVLPEKPLIMFAGEHTTPYHPSTMHGAFLSGIREAYRFDLYMEPVLNDQTTFDENIHVYKHTFSTKRVYKRTRAKKNTSKAAASSAESKDETLSSSANISNITTQSNGKTHSRHRGFGGMALRKRPDANTTPAIDTDSGNANAATNSAAATAISSPRKNGAKNGTTAKITSPTRRSQRSVGSVRNSILTTATASRRVKSIKDDGLDDPVIVEQMKSENKARTDLQEERTLVRALESYGQESHSLVRSHILPVYGSTRRRSLKHISDRWKRLRGENKDNNDTTNQRGSATAELAKSWEAKHVVSDNWDTHFARIAVDAAKEASVSSETVDTSRAPRRSQRGSKRRSFLDS